MAIDWGPPELKLTREQIAQVAFNAGFRGQVLIDMVAIAWRESGGHAGLYVDRPSTGDWSYGLWGLNVGRNMQWWSQYERWGISSPAELRTAAGNAKAAFAMYQEMGERPWGPYKGRPYTYSTDLNAARSAVDNARAQGMLGGGQQATAFGAPNNAANTTATTGPVELPTDAKLVRTPYGIFALFDLGGGVWTHYGIRWWDGSVKFSESQVETISQATWDQRYTGSVHGGDATELATVRSTFSTFSAFWESVLAQTIGFTNPARNDPEVRKVLAEFAARPDMSQAELENRLKATAFWQTKSQMQLEWNGLSAAEKQIRLSEMSARMESAWFQHVGKDLQFTDAGYNQWVEKLASGEVAFGQWQESVVKPFATQNPESPWSRTLRSEVEAQRERPIAIENSVNQIRDTVRRWGIEWSDARLKQFATGLLEKTVSDDDLLKQIRAESKARYAWKDESVDLATASSPWVATYNRVMEQAGDWMTPEVNKALQAGEAVWDFEQRLKRSDGWMGTQNGQETMYDTIGEAGRLLGFTR